MRATIPSMAAPICSISAATAAARPRLRRSSAGRSRLRSGTRASVACCSMRWTPIWQQRDSRASRPSRCRTPRSSGRSADLRSARRTRTRAGQPAHHHQDRVWNDAASGSPDPDGGGGNRRTSPGRAGDEGPRARSRSGWPRSAGAEPRDRGVDPRIAGEELFDLDHPDVIVEHHAFADEAAAAAE